MERRTYQKPELELVEVADEVITGSNGFNISIKDPIEGSPDDID